MWEETKNPKAMLTHNPGCAHRQNKKQDVSYWGTPQPQHTHKLKASACCTAVSFSTDNFPFRQQWQHSPIN